MNEFAKEENLLYRADAFWDENNSSSEFSAKFVKKPQRTVNMSSRNDGTSGGSFSLSYGNESGSAVGSSRLNDSS